MRSVVVLPQPDGPSSAKNDPAGISSEIPSTAVTWSKDLTTDSSRTSLADDIGHRLGKDLRVQIDVCLARGGRHQGHVVEGGHQDAAVERVEVQESFQLLV